MTTSRFTCPAALLCAFVVVSVATCGCASISGTTDRWATAWKKSTEPKPVDPNHEEIVTYWGQKKKEPKRAEMPPELKERMAKKADESQRSRDYADNFKTGNQHLKEGRLDEARRAYELALAARPDDPDVHHRLAVVADKQKFFGVADDHYEAALRKRPRDPNLLSDIGYSHALRGDDRGAETTLREALAIDPSHKGAMLNLGTLYGKQRRYDDALGLLRRGTTEAETSQYMTQLFPQGRPADVALASNQGEAGSRVARPIPSDERTNVKTMTTEQLKAEWERRLLEENQYRPQQHAQAPSQRDWTGDSPMQDPKAMQDQRSAPAPNNQPWSAGQPFVDQWANPPHSNNPGLGQASPYSPQPQGGNAMQPGATTIPLPHDLQPGSPMLPYPGPASNGAVQRPGFAPNSGQGLLVAPPGTRPHSNIDFWQGAPVQPNAGAFNPNPAFQQPSMEQSGHSQGADGSASQAAAQLGLSVGPGSLFPIVSGDSASAGGMSLPPRVAPPREQRLGSEYSQPPQLQNFNSQSAPSSTPHQGRASSQGHDGSTSGQFPSNWQGAASSRSSGGTLPNFAGFDTSAATAAPSGNTSRPWDVSSNGQSPNSNAESTVIQAGGLSRWGESASRINDSLEAYQSNVSAPPRTSRYAKAPWDEPASQPNQPGGSRPYNGAWPSSNDQPNASSSGSGGSSNSPPMWNGGSGAGASTSSGAGPATGNSSGNTPPQWPYSSQR